MSEHPAVMKAKHLGRIGFDNGWKGTIESENGTTFLRAERNDEKVIVHWEGDKLAAAAYYIFDRETFLSCAKQVSEKLSGWPNLIQLFKWFPDMNHPNLVKTYCHLPFDWENDSDDRIIAALVGNQIHWYSNISTKIHSDVVLPPKGKKRTIEIKPVGHRKMFNFIGTQAGFRSVLLDTILKVG